MVLKEKELFEGFRSELLESLGATSIESQTTPESIAKFLHQLNHFLYQDYNDGDNDYISKFHKFWELNHEEIMGFRIDEKQCLRVAEVLERIFEAKPFKVDADVQGLSKPLIANVRYFTIVQDFKIRFRKDPYELARVHPEFFDANSILNHFPQSTNELLDFLGAKSQADKRQKFSRLSAELLVRKYKGDAYNIAREHNNDAIAIVNNLVANPDEEFTRKLGFSVKKAIIFVRDMIDLDVWSLNNPEALDIPSDANTMKLALRTGILRLRVPLLASYLDVYCSQYESTDRWSRKAWRSVWDSWAAIPGNHRPPAPAFFDYLIYRAGQNWNKPTKMPEVNWFKDLCPADTRELNPPKSISIYGQTGWESGRSNEGGGLGISS